MSITPLTNQLAGAPGVENVLVDNTVRTETDSTFKIGLVGWTPKGPSNIVTTITNTATLYNTFGTPTASACYNQLLYAAAAYIDAGASVKIARVSSGAAESLDYTSISLSAGTGYSGTVSTAAGAGSNQSNTILYPAVTATNTASGYVAPLSAVLAGLDREVLAPNTTADSPFTVWSLNPGSNSLAVSLSTYNTTQGMSASTSVASALSGTDPNLINAIIDLGYYFSAGTIDENGNNVGFDQIINKLGVLKVYDTSTSITDPVETWVFTTDNEIDSAGTQYKLDTVVATSDYIAAKINPSYVVGSNWVGKGYDGLKWMLSGGSVATYLQASNSFADGWKLFLDRDFVDVDMISAAGTNINMFGIQNGGVYSESYNVGVITAMANLCNTRMDCYGIIDAVRVKAVTGAGSVVEKSSVIPGSALYSWLTIYDNRDVVFDSWTRSNVEYAKTISVGVNIASMRSSGVLWNIAAGNTRGALPGTVISQAFTRSYPTEVGALFSANINPTRTSSSNGMVIWGERTLYKKNSVRRDQHVVALLASLFKRYDTLLNNMIFEINTSDLRASIRSQIDSDLSSIMKATPQGLYKKQVVCDDSNNTADVINARRLLVDIYLWPSLGIEVATLRITANLSSNEG